MSLIAILDEVPAHHHGIAALHGAAFGGVREAALVERLRLERLVVASLVALDRSDLVGHILFSTLKATVDGRTVKAAALAPMAVRPDRQRQGIGARLVAAGLLAIRERHYEAVIVLGHANYYPRFGFSSALARKLDAPFRGDSFMAMELAPGALRGDAGTLTYPSAFDPG